MAAMNTNIPMMGQGVNALQAIQQGTAAAGLTNQNRRNNALEQFMQTNGGAVMAGDEQALGQYAALAGPEAALGVQNTRQVMDVRTQANSRADSAELRAIQTHAATLSKNERDAMAEEVRQGLVGAVPFVQSGDVAGFNARIAEFGLPPVADVAGMQNLMAQGKDTYDAMIRSRDLASGPAPQSPDGKRQADIDAGLLDPNSGGADYDMTESERRIFMFNNMQSQTAPAINRIEAEGFDPSNVQDRFASGVLGGNWLRSTEGQMYESAGGAWAEGALRLATGAAATPEEYTRIKGMYFAQVGDTLETIQFKRAMRDGYQEVLGATLRGDVNAEIPNPLIYAINEFYGQEGNPEPSPSGTPPPAAGLGEPPAAPPLTEDQMSAGLNSLMQSPNFDIVTFSSMPIEQQVTILRKRIEQGVRP
jgi:hypothetical protein